MVKTPGKDGPFLPRGLSRFTEAGGRRSQDPGPIRIHPADTGAECASKKTLHSR